MCYGEVISPHQLRKSRKVHVCSMCRQTIEPGDYYSHSVIKDEGEFCVYKDCERCASKVTLLSENGASDDGCIYDLKGHLQQLAQDIGWKQMRAEFRKALSKFRSKK